MENNSENKKSKFLIFFLFFSSIASFFSLFGQYYFTVISKIHEKSFFALNLTYFSYFTIQTNLIIGIFYIYSLIKLIFNKQNFSDYINNNNSLKSALLVYIIIVSLIYNIVLRKLWVTKGLLLIIDNFLHVINPIIYLFFWILFSNKTKLKFKYIFFWLIYPLAYLFIMLLYGLKTKIFPYFFLNFYKIGLLNTLIYIFFMILLFFVISFVLVLISKFKVNKIN